MGIILLLVAVLLGVLALAVYLTREWRRSRSADDWQYAYRYRYWAIVSWIELVICVVILIVAVLKINS